VEYQPQDMGFYTLKTLALDQFSTVERWKMVEKVENPVQDFFTLSSRFFIFVGLLYF